LSRYTSAGGSLGHQRIFFAPCALDGMPRKHKRDIVKHARRASMTHRSRLQVFELIREKGMT